MGIAGGAPVYFQAHLGILQVCINFDNFSNMFYTSRYGKHLLIPQIAFISRYSA